MLVDTDCSIIGADAYVNGNVIQYAQGTSLTVKEGARVNEWGTIDILNEANVYYCFTENIEDPRPDSPAWGTWGALFRLSGVQLVFDLNGFSLWVANA